MNLQFTAEGLQIQTYDEIVAELEAAYRAIYGADINLSPDSPDGQRVGIEAKARLDVQMLILDLYNSMDPDLAVGDRLNRILKLCGVNRRVTTRSQVDVTITTDRDLILPVGYAVADDLDQTWITTEAADLTTGANTVTLVAEEFGAVAADVGTITTPATVVIGVVSVTNPAAATVGIDEETDPTVRVRRNRSLTVPAASSRGAMYTALANVAGVTGVEVYENDSDALDATLNLAAHSIWCVVEGGTVADIAETIAKTKTGGTGLKGSTTGTFVETVQKPDGTTREIIHSIPFDRPTPVALHVRLTVQGHAGVTPDSVAIKAALAARTFEIAEIADASKLYANVYSVGVNFTATALEISDDGVTFAGDAITPAANEKFTISTANVTVTVI